MGVRLAPRVLSDDCRTLVMASKHWERASCRSVLELSESMMILLMGWWRVLHLTCVVTVLVVLGNWCMLIVLALWLQMIRNEATGLLIS